MNEYRIKTEQLCIAYDKTVVVENLNVEIPTGKITALVGANGSGKSTILRTIARLLSPQSGQVLLDGKSIQTQSVKDVSKKLAFLPQNPAAPEGLTVFDLVSFGRFPHKTGFKNITDEDREIIAWAMKTTNTLELESRLVDELSGGQRQRVWIAMALAQQTEILFLDEPTTFLDMSHQLDVLELLKKLNEEQHRTIVMVVHDLNQATRYAHNIIAIRHGKPMCVGTPKDIMNKEMLKDIFSIDAEILSDPRDGILLCVPYKLSQSIDCG